MKKEQVWKLLVLLLLILNTVTIAYFYFSSQNKDIRPGQPDQLIIEGLHLDKEQIEAFQLLKMRHRNKMDSIEIIEANIRKNLFLEVQKGPVNEGTAIIYLNELNDIRAMRDMATLDHFKEIYLLCRPNQKIYYKNTIEEISKILMRPRPPHN